MSTGAGDDRGLSLSQQAILHLATRSDIGVVFEDDTQIKELLSHPAITQEEQGGLRRLLAKSEHSQLNDARIEKSSIRDFLIHNATLFPEPQAGHPRESTSGSPAYPDQRKCPRKLVRWRSFDKLLKVWYRKFQDIAGDEKCFAARTTTEALHQGNDLQHGCEATTVSHFHRNVLIPVQDALNTLVNMNMSTNSSGSATFLNHKVAFNNHTHRVQNTELNTGTDETNVPNNVQPQDTKLVDAKKKITIPDFVLEVHDVSDINGEPGLHTAAQTLEAKSLHKLQRWLLEAATEEDVIDVTELTDALRPSLPTGPPCGTPAQVASQKLQCRKIFAGLVCQEYDYMLRHATNFGAIVNGRDQVLLWVDWDHPDECFFYYEPHKKSSLSLEDSKYILTGDALMERAKLSWEDVLKSPVAQALMFSAMSSTKAGNMSETESEALQQAVARCLQRTDNTWNAFRYELDCRRKLLADCEGALQPGAEFSKRRASGDGYQQESSKRRKLASTEGGQGSLNAQSVHGLDGCHDSDSCDDSGFKIQQGSSMAFGQVAAISPPICSSPSDYSSDSSVTLSGGLNSTIDSSLSPDEASEIDGSPTSSSRRFCSIECIQSLIQGKAADQMCPNFRAHKTIAVPLRPSNERFHSFSDKSFRDALCRQYCDESTVGFRAFDQGQHGVAFEVCLKSHEYRLIGKGFSDCDQQFLEKEIEAYDDQLSQFEPLSFWTPVFAGRLDLPYEIYYYGYPVKVMILLCWGGERTETSMEIRQTIHEELLKHGIEHTDLRQQNILKHPRRTDQPCVIDWSAWKLVPNR